MEQSEVITSHQEALSLVEPVVVAVVASQLVHLLELVAKAASLVEAEAVEVVL